MGVMKQMIINFFKTNWFLIILPSILCFILWVFHEKYPKEYQYLDNKSSQFAKRIVVFLF